MLSPKENYVTLPSTEINDFDTIGMAHAYEQGKRFFSKVIYILYLSISMDSLNRSIN